MIIDPYRTVNLSPRVDQDFLASIDPSPAKMSSSGDTNADDQEPSTFHDNGNEAPIELYSDQEAPFLGLDDIDENYLICEEGFPIQLFQEEGIAAEHDGAGSSQQALGDDEFSTWLVSEENRLKPAGEDLMEGLDQFGIFPESYGGDIPMSSQHNDQGGSWFSDLPENLSPAMEDQFEPAIRSPPPDLLAAAWTRGSGLNLNKLLPTPSDRANNTLLVNNNKVKLKEKSVPRSAGKEPAQSSGNCNCYKSDCLNRSCPCLAADVRCGGSCSCWNQMCCNRSKYGFLFTGKQNKLKPLTPLVIGATQHVPNSPFNAKEYGEPVASLRHIKGCGCKMSRCRINSCGCNKREVGCSYQCNCDECNNQYGKKPDYRAREHNTANKITIGESSEERPVALPDKPAFSTTYLRKGAASTRISPTRSSQLTSSMPPPRPTSTAPVFSASPVDQTPDMNKSVISQDSSAASQGGNSTKPKPQDSKRKVGCSDHCNCDEGNNHYGKKPGESSEERPVALPKKREFWRTNFRKRPASTQSSSTGSSQLTSIMPTPPPISTAPVSSTSPVDQTPDMNESVISQDSSAASQGGNSTKPKPQDSKRKLGCSDHCNCDECNNHYGKKPGESSEERPVALPKKREFWRTYFRKSPTSTQSSSTGSSQPTSMPPPSTSTALVSSASPVDQTLDMNKSVISQDPSAATGGGNSTEPKPQGSKDPNKPHDDNSTK